jgi:hypothetical protein
MKFSAAAGLSNALECGGLPPLFSTELAPMHTAQASLHRPYFFNCPHIGQVAVIYDGDEVPGGGMSATGI